MKRETTELLKAKDALEGCAINCIGKVQSTIEEAKAEYVAMTKAMLEKADIDYPRLVLLMVILGKTQQNLYSDLRAVIEADHKNASKSVLRDLQIEVRAIQKEQSQLVDEFLEITKTLNRGEYLDNDKFILLSRKHDKAKQALSAKVLALHEEINLLLGKQKVQPK